MNIYVGNLAYQTTEDELRNNFAQYGNVTSVNLIMDRMTNQSKGFAFVDMPDNSEADAAIKGLNQNSIDGRTITVNQAKPRTENRSSHRAGGRY